MKQTFYVYELIDGEIRISSKKRSLSMENGTITLDVEPIKKEVEKVIENPCIFRSLGSGLQVTQTIPSGAYNVKVTYTIKE